MFDDHVQSFNELMGYYTLPVCLTGWSTKDLVSLANAIDIELQQRAQEVSVDPETAYEYEEDDK